MEFRENEAIYLQVADFVNEHIMRGKWVAGEKLPSVRELAATLQVNPRTVVRAYEILQARDVISNKRGIGFFIDDNALEKIKRFSKEEFLSREMPELIKRLYLFDIPVSEIEKALKDYIKTLNQIKNI